MSEPYIPDVGDTFTVTRTWAYRRWQWRPFPWYRRRVIAEQASYRVESWLRRRQPRPEPKTEEEASIRQMIDEMIADGRIEGPRVAGPDRVPLEWCLRDEAEYVSGVGVGGTIQRIADITVTGRVPWAKEIIESHRQYAIQLGLDREPLT